MTPPTLTPEAKSLLSTTIRALRTRLIDDLTERAKADYRLGIKAAQANLPEARRKKRALLEAWIDERVRASTSKESKSKESADDARARFLRDAVKLAAATWLNRVVLLRHMEAMELSKPLVVTGGWDSRGYRQFREFAPALLAAGDGGGAGERDETEGYALLLQLVFDELAVDLPGLFGDVGLLRLFPMPAATLRDRAARDRVEDADVHRAVHGRVAAAKQPRAHLAGHVQKARVDGGRRAGPAAARCPPRRVAIEARRR